MKTVAVLLTVFNRKNKTLQCLEKLYKQLPIENHQVDIYLTNDGCTDGTPEAIAQKFPEVNIIHSKGNLFWNRGMYTAWEEATKRKEYDYYLWLNDDTFIYPDSISRLLNDSTSVKDEAIICGATCSEKDGKPTYGGRNNNGIIPPNGSLQICQHFNGNVVLIPRYVYQRIGDLDYTYSHALGDFDYGLRAEKLGIKSYQSKEYIGTCEQHNSLAKWCNSSYPLKERIRVFHSPLGGHPKENFYFERKHYGVFPACLHYFTIHLRLFIPQIWEKRK